MNVNQTLRLGTRRSALAWVQSSQVAAACAPRILASKSNWSASRRAAIVVLDRPLSAMEGKEFFTAEIDSALREGRVDFTVHSLKDLSLERPPEFVLAAVPRRANPRDIAIFAPDVPQRLAQARDCASALPRRGVPNCCRRSSRRRCRMRARNTITLENLRGNVDSRLRRLLEPRGSERHLDGIVLALAGLSRLFADTITERAGPASCSRICCEGLHLMVLPLTGFPGAPGQGALAIECRADDAATRALLAALEDPATRGAITVERQLLAEHGGGCHQRFGATLQWLPGLGGLLQIAGAVLANVDLAERRWLPQTALPEQAGAVRAWDGSTAERPRPRRCWMPAH